MKKHLLLILVILVGIGFVAFNLQGILNGKMASAQQDTTQTVGQNTDQANQSNAQNQSTSEQPQPTPVQTTSAKVSVVSLVKNQAGMITTLGTVKAVDQVKVFPATNGQVKSVKVKEGDKVKAGDVLFEIGGVNGTKHPLVTQLELAQANYNNASKGLGAIKQGNEAALRSAQLQVQSAQNQATGTGIDLGIINRNIESAQDGLTILQNSLDATRYKNQQDLDKTQYGINTLQDAIQKVQTAKADTLQNLYNQLNMTSDPVQQAALQQQIQKAIMDFDKQISELNIQLQNAYYGYETVKSAVQLTENQLLAQIAQTEGQIDVLNYNRDSAQAKTGYDGNATDMVRIAEEGVEATKVKNNASTIQGQSQFDVAKVNLSVTKDQQAALIVRAPLAGTVGEITVRQGDIVGPQASVTQIVDTQNYELKVAVNPTDAEKITLDSKAEVQLAGRFVPVSVKSISPITDPTTKLVNVTLNLPRVMMRANQTLNARIMLQVTPNVEAGQTEAIFVPLDALIIGTEEKYVYVFDNGVARKRNVTIGIITGDQVQVLSGINDNDQVIVNGAKNLLDGDAVSLN